MVVESIQPLSGERSDNEAEGLPGALSALDDLDGARHLSRAAAIALFFVSAAIAVWAFFVLNDLTLREGIEEYVASAMISIAWVAIFPIWIVCFLVTLVGLDALGVRDLRSAAARRLSRLDLGPAELAELAGRAEAGRWKHADLFRRAVAGAAERGRTPDPAGSAAARETG